MLLLLSVICVVPVAYDTAAAKVGVIAVDVVVIDTGVSVFGVTTALWCCWYYSAAVLVVSFGIEIRLLLRRLNY